MQLVYDIANKRHTKTSRKPKNYGVAFQVWCQESIPVHTWNICISTQCEPNCGAGSNTGGILQLSVLDLGKAAKLVTDICAVSQEADLTRIQVLNDELDFLEATRRLVRSQAQVGLGSLPHLLVLS